MLRLCSRRVASLSKLCAAVPLQPVQAGSLQLHTSAPRQLGTVSSASTAESLVSDPDRLPDGWTEVEDWSMIWFDGRDKVHVRVKADGSNTDWRGLGFYSREAYWLGALRWNESLRGEKPAVWLHWVGKDPVEIATKLPHPDANGCYTFTVGFEKREFVLHCNGELLGTRKNMLYQFKNIGRLFFADLECVGGQYVIEGDHTDDCGYTTYDNVPMFQKASDMWRLIRKGQREHAEGNVPDHGWRSS